jgi:hypothetical protein
VKDHSASDRQQGKNKQKINKKQQQIPALPQKGQKSAAGSLQNLPVSHLSKVF